jgi:hypothetical protein
MTNSIICVGARITNNFSHSHSACVLAAVVWAVIGSILLLTKHHYLQMHFVHLKKGLTLNESLYSDDGLAVVGVFFARGNNGRALRPLERSLQDSYAYGQFRFPVRYYAVEIEIIERFRL